MSDELATAYDALGCLVLGIDQQAKVDSINRFGLTLLGYDDQAQVVGQPLRTLLPEGDSQSGRIVGDHQ